MKSFKLLVFSIFAIFNLLANNKPVDAQGVNDFVINSFDADYELSNKDPQGFLEITESIDLTYSRQNRGIIRVIPAIYREKDLNLKVISVNRDGKTEPYISYKENNNNLIRIGEPSVYITGVHSYVIQYQLENVIQFYDNYDELYWDVNGDQWLQPFTNVSATVRTIAPLNQDNHPACFTGSYGDTNQDCAITQDSYKVTYSTISSLEPGHTLTFVRAFDKGFFAQESWIERNWGLIVASPIFLMQFLLVYTSYKQWRKYGKDYDRSGIVAPYFDKPKGLSVMQASYVLDNKLEPKHLSGSIIDLAIRNNIKIIESGEGRKTKHKLELVRLPDDYTTKDEEILLNALYSSMEVGNIVTLESSKNKLFNSVKEISDQLDNRSIVDGYYELSPKNSFKKQIPHLIGMAILFMVSFWFTEFTNGVSLFTAVLMVLLIVIFTILMTKRSVKGNLLVDHMKGLELYLEKAEKDRLKMQDAVSAPLAKNSHQPIRDRDFFEKLLPYAVTLGVEKSWAKAFKDIYTEPPDWYQGNWSSFSTVSLVNSVSTAVKASNNSFSAPSSSGSSGFSSGGGFSGGGGGGGGGGGW